MNKPKQIGTQAESAVVKYAQTHGFPGAERLALKGNLDEGDLTFCPGVGGEVKAGHAAEQASDAQIEKWLIEAETERLNRRADIMALVLKRKGKGAANAGQWWVILPGVQFVQLTGGRGTFAFRAPAVRITLAEFCELARWFGYGDRMDTA